VKGVIRLLRDSQIASALQSSYEGPQKADIGKIVSRSLDEKHRDLHGREVVCASNRWLAGGMQRKCKEHEPTHSGEPMDRLRLRRHSPAEGPAARKQG
jgi:hypothetical protein